VNYGKENDVSCDVLVLGGGIAGCWAAIGAAREGAKVVMVEKSVTRTRGYAGRGRRPMSTFVWGCPIRHHLITSPRLVAGMLEPEE
jgi:glycine/D-amino acid oxidase-like deaminating enzyme